MKKTEITNSLREARRLIKYISQQRLLGRLPDIEVSTVEELMSYLIPLSDENQIADNLENFCIAAIRYGRSENEEEYAKYLKLIIRIGKDLK